MKIRSTCFKKQLWRQISDHFEIQRSDDGKTWSSIGTQRSNGESIILQEYNFRDVSPKNGINYYRLKMVDQDETFSFSGIRSVKFESLSISSPYPNPVSDYLTSSLIEQLSITNINGKEVYSTQEPVSANGIDVKNFQSGIYLVNIQLKNGTLSTHKIMIK